jgi:hypothetical protein
MHPYRRALPRDQILFICHRIAILWHSVYRSIRQYTPNRTTESAPALEQMRQLLALKGIGPNITL